MSPSPSQVAALLVAAAAVADIVEQHPSAGPRATSIELIAAAAEHAAVATPASWTAASAGTRPAGPAPTCASSPTAAG